MNNYTGMILPNGDDVLIFTDKQGSAYFLNGEEITDKAKVYELEQVIDGLTGEEK